MSSCCVENPSTPPTDEVFIDDDGINTKEPVLGHSKIKDSIKYNKEKMKQMNKKKNSNNNNNNNSQSQLTESVNEEAQAEEGCE